MKPSLIRLNPRFLYLKHRSMHMSAEEQRRVNAAIKVPGMGWHEVSRCFVHSSVGVGLVACRVQWWNCPIVSSVITGPSILEPYIVASHHCSQISPVHSLLLPGLDLHLKVHLVVSCGQAGASTNVLIQVPILACQDHNNRDWLATTHTLVKQVMS